MVVGHEVTREPEWSPLDVRLVLAEFLWEKSLNPLGIPIDEATSDEAREDNYEGAYYYRRGESPVIDWSMKQSLDWEAAYKTKFPSANLNGYIFPVTKTLRAKQ